uniref:SPARC related modular calcium binding 1 n=1 Tax=Terrapene triunguis TaxID=2587831 RepID=A0A674IHU2_9SAUR
MPPPPQLCLEFIYCAISYTNSCPPAKSHREPGRRGEFHERGPPCPAECPRERHRPVCASDGKLYRSQCVFQRARCQEPLLQSPGRGENSPRPGPESPNLPPANPPAPVRGHLPCASLPTQVQCHRQTGYCWCATAEGQPVSGTSVLNQTPNCTGTWPPPPPPGWGRLSFRGQSKPRPTPASPPPHKQEGKRPPPPRPPFIGGGGRPRLTARTSFPPSCEQERLEALEEIQRHQQEGTFVPECEGDGTYKPVQCHQATGYCWCMQADTGRPVPGTSTRSVSNCESDAAAKSAEMGSLFRDRALPGGEGAWGTTNGLGTLTSMGSWGGGSGSPATCLEERAARWHFVRLDKDFSAGLSERELRPLKLYVKQHTRPKRCARKFLEYCDLDANRLVSLPELRGCLGSNPARGGRLGRLAGGKPSSRYSQAGRLGACAQLEGGGTVWQPNCLL